MTKDWPLLDIVVWFMYDIPWIEIKLPAHINLEFGELMIVWVGWKITRRAVWENFNRDPATVADRPGRPGHRHPADRATGKGQPGHGQPANRQPERATVARSCSRATGQPERATRARSTGQPERATGTSNRAIGHGQPGNRNGRARQPAGQLSQ